MLGVARQTVSKVNKLKYHRPTSSTKDDSQHQNEDLLTVSQAPLASQMPPDPETSAKNNCLLYVLPFNESDLKSKPSTSYSQATLPNQQILQTYPVKPPSTKLNTSKSNKEAFKSWLIFFHRNHTLSVLNLAYKK